MTERRSNFDDNWRFSRGAAPRAHEPGFNDSRWMILDLPHDWSIELPFSEKDPGGSRGGYLPGGIGWYRKSFTLSSNLKGKRVAIEFDGVYMNATVWLNGHKLGIHHYGYTSFRFDLTPFLKSGRERNALAVRVDNSRRPNTRWYSGSGIYRHVWLTVSDDIHVAHWGVSVRTVSASKSAAVVEISTDVENESAAPAEVRLETLVLGPDGKKAGSAADVKRISALGKSRFIRRIVVKRPALWDVESPALYRAVTRVTAGAAKDEVTTGFGIRTFRFDPDNGFILNGRRLKLKGVDLHHDHGCLGAAVHDRAEERKIELMKGIGANAIRTSHNPPSPEFLDACDRLGMVVMDEAFDEWEEGKLKYGYKDYFKKCWRDDLTSMVMRDRNHPCVFLWSIGNEVKEQGKLRGARIAAMLARHIRKLDPTRPVGYGAHPGPWTEQLWNALDVCGYNYRDDLYASDHKRYPKRCILGSETFSLYAFQTWTRAADNRHIIGEFIWTGMDYIGESGIGFSNDAESKYPVNTACCGELDICGFKKIRSYYSDILWDNGTKLRIAVRRPLAQGEPFKRQPWGWADAKSSWTWPHCMEKPSFAPAEMHVDVYSACEEVELRLNGKTLGRNTTSRATRYMATWVVPYEPGLLEAIGYAGGKRVASHVLRTAGAPALPRLAPDRASISADGRDLSFVTLEIRDDKGNLHPDAVNDIEFSIKGPGRIIGIGNGNPADIESFQASRHKAHNGRCLVVVKSAGKPGRIELTARSKGLKPGRAIIDAVSR